MLDIKIRAKSITALLLTVSPLIIFAIGNQLNCRDTLDAGAHANHIRNVLEIIRNIFELTSFIATTCILFTAVGAFIFTAHQLKEAKSARVAALYSTLEARWSSAEMLRSKASFAKMTHLYRNVRSSSLPPGTRSLTQPEFFDAYLTKLRRENPYKYSSIMSLIDYFEYIGMLAINDYINEADMEPLIGRICIEIWSVMSTHIEKIRAEATAENRALGFNAAPAEYDCLAALAKIYVDRFRRDRSPLSRS